MQVPGARPFDLGELSDRCIPEPWELVEWHVQLPAVYRKPKTVL